MYLTSFRKISIFVLSVLFLTGLFIKAPWLNNVTKIGLLVVLCLSFIKVKGPSRVIGYLLFLISAIILFIYQADSGEWFDGLTRNLYLVVMFSLVPLLGLPIQKGGYMKELQAFFRHHVREDSRFYIFVNVITFVVAVMVNVAAVPLMYQICQASDKSKNVRLLSTAIVRGFSACIIWAPSYAAVALIMELTGANWMDFFPYALVTALLALLPGWFLMGRERGEFVNGSSVEEQIDIDNNHDRPDWKKILELGCFCFLLIAGIVVVSNQTGISTVTVVSIFSLFFPLLWMTLIRKLPQLLEGIKDQYYGESLGKLSNEVVLFVGAGLFSTAVSFSHLGDMVPQIINYFVHNNALGFSFVVIAFTILLGMVGVHPIITITVVGSTVDPQAFNLDSTMMALTLSASWAMGVVASPSSAVNIAMAGLIDKSVDIGPRWNTVYAFLALAVIIVAMGVFRLL